VGAPGDVVFWEPGASSLEGWSAQASPGAHGVRLPEPPGPLTLHHGSEDSL
jgi:hypothetical protein